MNAQIEKGFNQLEANRKALFDTLKQYPDDLLNKKPSEQAWSVAEVVDHVLTAEEYSLKYLQKKVQDVANAKPEGFKQKWRWLLIKVVFNFNIKFPAPEVVAPKAGYQTKAQMEARWNENRKQMHSILSKLNDKEINSQLWKHALAGKMNLHHMVEFLGMHFNRHRKQIDRTLAAVK
ncbi:MAG TPA: DinB family protein [Chitinophagales bacterium]|nr:DinB family protein [Chitinophagales bacterium]